MVGSRRSLLGWTLASLLVATPAAAQQRPMTIVDLLEVPRLSGPRLSPDVSQVLYSRSDADWDRNRRVSHIWRVDADGTDNVQLTNGEDGESSPRWSPDGSRIAFLADRHDTEARQVYLINNGGGEAQVLTEHPTAVASIAWSPDGAWIYYVAADDETPEERARAAVNDNVYMFDETGKNRHLWRVEVATGSTGQITQGEFTLRGYELSRDGSLVAYSRAPSPRLDDGQLAEVWLARADGAEPRQLTDNGIGEGSIELSPDNSQLLFVANSNQEFEFYYNRKLFLMPVAGGTPQVVLPDFGHEINGASWSADGDAIYFTANTGVRVELFAVDPVTAAVEQLTRGDHTLGSWLYHPGRDLHLATGANNTSPGEVWMLRVGQTPRRITHATDYLTEEFLLPAVEIVQFPGEDGVTVEGLLYYPVDYVEGERYPLVVQTHGGPASSDKFGFGRSGVFTSHGYMVFKPNYRGSTGYGDDFLRDMVGHYFNQAHKDVMAGVDYLIERGLVDGERLAKMGWSAGGHMTNKIITYTDRFKAASSGAGAINWISMYGQSDVRTYRTPWFGGTPWEEDAPLQQYLRDSPLTELYKVTTPTIVMVGENDARVPMPQSVELYRGLKANGVPTHLYVAPRQGHGWRQLQQQLFKANAEMAWFEKWLFGREYEWERSPVHPQEDEEGQPES